MEMEQNFFLSEEILPQPHAVLCCEFFPSDNLGYQNMYIQITWYAKEQK